MTHALRFSPSFSFAFALSTLCLVGILTAPISSAQAEDRSASGLVIEEIIVTARKREESAQDVPVAITALSTELENSTIRSLADLNGFAPNVNIGVDASRGPGAASISIRGISPTRTDDNSLDAPIGVMVDGIYLGSLAGQVVENFDIERVEILRGPQGTLFGKNTVGGVVNIVRSRPTGELGARLKFTAGKWGQQEMRAVLNAPVIDDALAAKVFFTNIQADGFIRNTFLGRDLPKKDFSNYGITFLATPNDQFEALLTIEKFDDSSELGAFLTNWNTDAGTLSPPSDPREPDYSGGFRSCTAGYVDCRTTLDTPSTSTTNLSNPAEFEVDALTLSIQYDISEKLRLVSVTGYRDMLEYRKSDFDGASGNYITIERDNDYEQFSEELRLEWTGENLSLVGGVYYWNSEFVQDWVTGGEFWSHVLPILVTNVEIAPGLGALQACWLGAFGAIRCDTGAPLSGLGAEFVQILYEDQTTESTALFAQAEWQFATDLTLTLGMRWTDEKKDFVAGQAYLAPLDRAYIDNHPGYADLSNDWQEISPKIGLAYQFSDDVLFYASYSEGFHSGGFFGVNQNVADFERDQYDPEFAHSLELGMKGQFLDNRMQFNATFFHNDFEDKQEQAVQFDPTTNTVATVFSNVATAIYWGVEGELKLVVNEYVNLFASVGYLNAEYDQFETDLNPNDGQDILEDATHLVPRNAPETTWAIGGTATWPVGPGDVSVYAKYTEIGEIETSLINQHFSRLDPREYADASVSYSWNNLRATLFGRNLADDVFEIPFPIAASDTEGWFSAATINPGRSWGMELEIEL